LPYWTRGCNKLNEKHPTIVNLLKELNLEDIFSVQEVPVITFNKLLNDYNIANIVNLKIDTEGFDHVIFEDVISSILLNKVQIDNITLEYIPLFKNIQAIDDLYETIKHIYPKKTILNDNLHLSKI